MKRKYIYITALTLLAAVLATGCGKKNKKEEIVPSPSSNYTEGSVEKEYYDTYFGLHNQEPRMSYHAEIEPYENPGKYIVEHVKSEDWDNSDRIYHLSQEWTEDGNTILLDTYVFEKETLAYQKKRITGTDGKWTDTLWNNLSYSSLCTDYGFMRSSYEGFKPFWYPFSRVQSLIVHIDDTYFKEDQLTSVDKADDGTLKLTLKVKDDRKDHGESTISADFRIENDDELYSNVTVDYKDGFKMTAPVVRLSKRNSIPIPEDLMKVYEKDQSELRTFTWDRLYCATGIYTKDRDKLKEIIGDSSALKYRLWYDEDFTNVLFVSEDDTTHFMKYDNHKDRLLEVRKDGPDGEILYEYSK